MSDGTLTERLRKRAEIRRKDTCRGLEDRIATLLEEAADRITWLEEELRDAQDDRDNARSELDYVYEREAGANW